MWRILVLLVCTFASCVDGTAAKLKAENLEIVAKSNEVAESAKQWKKRAEEMEARAARAESNLAELRNPKVVAPPPAAKFEESPALTAKVYEIEEDFPKYAGKCLYLDHCWVSGDIELKGREYVVEIKDDRNKTYTGFGGEMKFICSKEMANAVRGFVDANILVGAKIYCAVQPALENKRPVAEIYKIETYNLRGEVKHTITPGTKPPEKDKKDH